MPESKLVLTKVIDVIDLSNTDDELTNEHDILSNENIEKSASKYKTARLSHEMKQTKIL